jgi:hypothetical protein
MKMLFFELIRRGVDSLKLDDGVVTGMLSQRRSCDHGQE